MTKEFSYLKSKRGFTLIELIVVVVIIGVLVSIALPQYINFKEKAMATEAINTIAAIRKAEVIYKLERGGYITCWNNGEIETNLGLKVGSADWRYAASSAANLLIISAYRVTDYTQYIRLTISPNEDYLWAGGYPGRPRNADGS